MGGGGTYSHAGEGAGGANLDERTDTQVSSSFSLLVRYRLSVISYQPQQWQEMKGYLFFANTIEEHTRYNHNCVTQHHKRESFYRQQSNCKSKCAIFLLKTKKLSRILLAHKETPETGLTREDSFYAE